MRLCVIVPSYNNPQTIAKVVAAVRLHVSSVIVVDDGSGEPGRSACAALQEQGVVTVVHRPKNGGKGAAMKTGFATAMRMGFSHALQIDADGQHETGDIPAFLQAMEAHPDALVLACPRYDGSASRLRSVARRFTRLWVDLEVGPGRVDDAMIGFRIYPLRQVEQVHVVGNWMDFDIEIVVKLAWAGVPIVNVPTAVRYLKAEEGGVSHFRMVRDNLWLAWLHCRLCTLGCTRFVQRRIGFKRLAGMP